MEDGDPALVEPDRDARAEWDDLVGGPLGHELHPLDEDTVEDVVPAELACDDLPLAGRVALELEQLGPFDVLHSHHWFSGAAALPVARERGIPHVQSFHSIAADPETPLSEGERPESAGRIAGEQLLARESDAVVVVSEAEASTVRTRLGGADARIWIVPPGVDGSVFRPAAVGARYGDRRVAFRWQTVPGMEAPHRRRPTMTASHPSSSRD